jgi:hypothetical protein
MASQMGLTDPLDQWWTDKGRASSTSVDLFLSLNGNSFYPIFQSSITAIMSEKSPVHLAPSTSSSKDISDDKNPNIETVTERADFQDRIVIEDGLRRGLLGRHVTLISLASVIGASCFYAFGYALYLSGPLGALIGFSIIGEASPSLVGDKNGRC